MQCCYQRSLVTRILATRIHSRTGSSLAIYHFRQINLPFRKTGVDRSSKFRCRRSTSRIDYLRQDRESADWFDYKALQVYRSDSLANGSRTYFTIIVQLPAVSLLRTRRSGPPLYLVQSLRANVSTGGRHKS